LIPGSEHPVWVEGLSVTAIKTVEESFLDKVGIYRLHKLGYIVHDVCVCVQGLAPERASMAACVRVCMRG